MSIKVNVVTDFFGDGLKRAQREFQQLETTGAKAGYVLKRAMLPATAALGALAVGAKKAVAAASDLEESQSKINVIFQDGADDVENFAKQTAKSFGISRREALQAAGTLGTFGKAAGLANKDLANFTKDFTGLAADLASFNNTSPEDAIQAIGAALRGESEPIRRYGVLLNDATLKQRAMEMGIYDGVGALDQQTKILAATAEIFDQTSDAQGDFARTSEGLANSSRIMKAQMDDLKTSIGQGLLPVVQTVLPYLKQMSDWSTQNPDKFNQTAIAIGAIATSVTALNAAWKASIFFQSSGAFGPLGVLVAGFATAYAAIESFRLDVNRQYNSWVSVLEGIVNTAVRTINPIISALNAISPGTPFAKLGLISIPRLNTTPKSQQGAGFDALDQIPGLASGGVVTRPGLFMLAEGGESEAVIPLSKLGNMGGATTVNINVQGADPQAVVDALRRYMVVSGPVPIKVA